MQDRRAQEIARIRAQAAQLRADSDAALARGDAAGCARSADLAAIAEMAADMLESGEVPLRARSKMGTVGTMEAAQVRSKGASVSAAKTDKRTRTRFQELLQEANVSLPEWAATKRGLNVETAKSWVKRPGKGGRAIPREWANKLADEFKSPDLAEHDAWPNGIRE